MYVYINCTLKSGGLCVCEHVSWRNINEFLDLRNLKFSNLFELICFIRQSMGIQGNSDFALYYSEKWFRFSRQRSAERLN
jgi:hypothetical protein